MCGGSRSADMHRQDGNSCKQSASWMSFTTFHNTQLLVGHFGLLLP